METRIRKAKVEDVDSIVNIHKAAFESFFLTSLGERFLKLYYSTFIKSKKGVVYCAEKNDNVVYISPESGQHLDAYAIPSQSIQWH